LRRLEEESNSSGTEDGDEGSTELATGVVRVDWWWGWDHWGGGVGWWWVWGIGTDWWAAITTWADRGGRWLRLRAAITTWADRSSGGAVGVDWWWWVGG
jgi:hypothetical protein